VCYQSVIAANIVEKPSIEKQNIPSTHPILLNLLCPDALDKLRVTVSDVKQLYEQLKGVDPNGENGTIARNALLDTVDSSGINLDALESLLTQISEMIVGFNGRLSSCSLIRLGSLPLYSSRCTAKHRCMQSHTRSLPPSVGNCADSIQIGCHRKIKALHKASRILIRGWKIEKFQ
jgi:hypothetical protein